MHVCVRSTVPYYKGDLVLGQLLANHAGEGDAFLSAGAFEVHLSHILHGHLAE